jgi:hypothetical protein
MSYKIKTAQPSSTVATASKIAPTAAKETNF